MKKKMSSIIMSAMIFVSTFTFSNFQAISAKADTTSDSTAGINWMNNSKYFALGANYAWQDWGNDFNDNGWDQRYPKLKATLDDMASQGIHSVRWWVFCNMYASPLFTSTDGKGVCTGLPTKWVEHMKEITDYAYSKDMKIYYTFTSFDVATNTNDFYHGTIIDDLDIRKSFIDNAVTPIVQGLGDNPGVMGWDIINEPEWVISNADHGEPNGKCTPYSLSTMRSFVKDMADCIHKYAKQPVSVGSASMKWLGSQYPNFWAGLGLDFYDFHWYDWATPYFNPLKITAASLNLDKPVIIGEMMPDLSSSKDSQISSMTHEQILEGILKNGYGGYMLWSWTDTSGFNCEGKTTPYFAEFKNLHPALNIDNIKVITGDLNDDSKVDSADYLLLKNYLINRSTKIDTKAADINNDGKINVLDYLKLRKLIINA